MMAESEANRIRVTSAADAERFRIEGAALKDSPLLIQKIVADRARRFLDEAPMTAAAAATVILDGVKADRWRILVGEDAHKIDELVRKSPERAYDVDFFESLAAEVGWRVGR